MAWPPLPNPNMELAGGASGGLTNLHLTSPSEPWNALASLQLFLCLRQGRNFAVAEAEGNIQTTPSVLPT